MDSLNIKDDKQDAEGCQNSIKNFLGQNTHKALKKTSQRNFFGSIRSNIFSFQKVILL